MIKSSQHMTGSAPAETTIQIPIAAVVLDKTFIMGAWDPGSTRYVRLTSTTNVELLNDRNGARTYAFDVIEFL